MDDERKQFHEEIEEKLEELKNEMDGLGEDLVNATDSEQEAYEDQMMELQVLFNTLEDQLADMRNAASDDWELLKEDLNENLEDVHQRLRLFSNSIVKHVAGS